MNHYLQVPGFLGTSTRQYLEKENILATALFLQSLGLPEPALQLLPYHRLGASKYAALDWPYDLEPLPPMPSEAAEAVCRAYLDRGIRCSISR